MSSTTKLTLHEDWTVVILGSLIILLSIGGLTLSVPTFGWANTDQLFSNVLAPANLGVIGIQFLFVGSAYPWLHCSAFANVTGALLIGLAPLMLAYLIVAALASLMASAPEK